VGGSSPPGTPARLGGAPIVDDRFGDLWVGLWAGYAVDEIAERWAE
jgi:broad specificity phosphatase PhoE